MVCHISTDDLIDAIICNLEDLQANVLSEKDKQCLIIELQYLAYILGDDES